VCKPAAVAGASPWQKGAPGPVHEGKRWVRRLGIDREVENTSGAAYRSRGGGNGGARLNGFEGGPFYTGEHWN
jgi:hypothetical protein